MKKMKEYFNEEATKHDEIFIEKMGMNEFYDEIEKVLNNYQNKNSILVLGCGSGLEIERIKFPCRVVGVDISDKMLEVLNNKKLYDGVKLKTVCKSFLDLNFDKESYDIVLSCYAMHHFNLEQKNKIYKNIYSSLKAGGVFINGDTIAHNEMEEHVFMQKAKETYENKNIIFASLHIDVPFCWEHEQEVLRNANFSNITVVREWKNSKIYTCEK